ncbi:hypothetical protein N7450_003939 [Penicillium hetheringtonii]|uniref:Dienelactone hydrolase n=1 Tax=Penicillium hetheringtonii TaxID=911720 RepID=A0AAD6GUM9_9EURO|nr:hypothetical protein N7450_003939 [Penicillium hetheringtonii]
MVNVFRRLTRRATSSGSNPSQNGSSAVASTGPVPARASSHGRIHRSLSISSNKRIRRAPAEEPSPRHLLLISDTPEVDERILHRYQAEGFDTEYISFTCAGDPERDRKHLENVVHLREDELEAGERYAIVAFNRPAYYLLASHHLVASNTNPFPRLCALIAYYPITSTDALPNHPYNKEECAPACCDTSSIFDPGPSTSYLPIQVHIPGSKTDPATLWPWITISSSEGDVTYKKRHRCYVYTYPDAGFRFAEREFATARRSAPSDLADNAIVTEEVAEEDGVCEGLAWSRALACLRRAFGVGSNWAVDDIETVWEKYWALLLEELQRKSEDGDTGGINLSAAIMELITGNELGHERDSSIACVPTKMGGSGVDSLRSFFSHIFVPAGPASQHLRLLSRTVGADRIVDELSLSFSHTAEIPWLLPNVKPTNRPIKVIVVVVATFCADKIVHQSLYWDQADVLVQAGLLDPSLVPQSNE